MIHYHGTPCSGSTKEAVEFLMGRHALVPWPRPDNLGIVAEVCQSFCVDNGAFSAWRSGYPIQNWQGYYEWVGDLLGHPGFDWAVIPDVIDGDESANDKLVAEWPHGKFTGVPVWHMHESLGRLAKLCFEWPRVAIGSSGQYASVGRSGWWRRIGKAMDQVCVNGVPAAKLHGLRMLDPAVFHRLPLSSADSTNAVRNASNVKRFGQYCPPSAGARSGIIADRIERHQSATTWVPLESQAVLCFEQIGREAGCDG